MINDLLWDSSECKRVQTALFCFAFFIVYSVFFPSPIWHSSLPFAMCAYLMHYIPSDINNYEYCVYDLMYIMYVSTTWQ